MEYYNKIELIQNHLKDNLSNIKDITISETDVNIIFEDGSRINFGADVTDIILHIPESVSAIKE